MVSDQFEGVAADIMVVVNNGICFGELIQNASSSSESLTSSQFINDG